MMRRHGDQRVGDAAERVRHAVVVHAVVAALEHRMDEQRAAELVGRAPERIERGIVEHAADALRLRADHRACKARRVAPRAAPPRRARRPATARWQAGSGAALPARRQADAGSRGATSARLPPPAARSRTCRASRRPPGARSSARPSISAGPARSLSGFATGRVGLPPRTKTRTPRRPRPGAAKGRLRLARAPPRAGSAGRSGRGSRSIMRLSFVWIRVPPPRRR